MAAMRPWQQLLLLLFIALRTSAVKTKVTKNAIDHFTSREIRYCLREHYIWRVQNPLNEAGVCAEECLKLSSCQGFVQYPLQVQHNGPTDEISQSQPLCELFVFDKCSEDLTKKECDSVVKMAWVRNHHGLPPGALCSKDYKFRFGNSFYRIVPAADWHHGRDTCRAEFGMARFADATDAEEVAHMHRVRNSQERRKLSFFIDGYATDKSGKVWASADCQRPVPPEVWGPWQPNAIKDGHLFTDIWWQHKKGVDSTSSWWLGLDRALCECIDPFAL